MSSYFAVTVEISNNKGELKIWRNTTSTGMVYLDARHRYRYRAVALNNDPGTRKLLETQRVRLEFQGPDGTKSPSAAPPWRCGPRARTEHAERLRRSRGAKAAPLYSDAGITLFNPSELWKRSFSSFSRTGDENVPLVDGWLHSPSAWRCEHEKPDLQAPLRDWTEMKTLLSSG